MRGRFTDQIAWTELRALYRTGDATAPSNMQPRTEDVDFLRLDRDGNRKLDRGRWWLVPYGAKELPKVLIGDTYATWLDPTTADDEAKAILLERNRDGELVFYRVDRKVNSSIGRSLTG